VRLKPIQESLNPEVSRKSLHKLRRFPENTYAMSRFQESLKTPEVFGWSFTQANTRCWGETYRVARER
jgi:hypothetical protein